MYGKIKVITKTHGSVIQYSYDPLGNRINKSVTSSGTTKQTFYVRDAQGNVLTVYQSGIDTINTGKLTQTEVDIYGSSRLGIMRTTTNMDDAFTRTTAALPLLNTTGYDTSFTRGSKQYELSNHLGNVLVTVSDKKKAIRSVADTTVIDHYEADVITATDYYPFGMLMPGRSKYASEIGEVKQVQGCTSCSMLQQLVNDYFSTLSSGVGSETAMISYMQGRLAADSLSYTTTEILSALNTCGNSWKKNIGFHADVSSFLSYETSPQVRFHKEDFSVGAWIYPEAESSSIQTIVTNHTFTGGVMAGYRLYMLNGQIYFQMGDPNYALTDSGCAQIRTVNKITSLEWHDVIAVRNGNNAANFKIYVDGVLQQTEVADYPAIRSAGGDVYNEYVGRYVVGNGSGSGNNVNLFLGFIKNLKVYNRPVSAAVVLNNYNNSCTGSVDTTGLVLWSKIDEGTSTTVIDYSRYQTNGALALDAFGGGVGRAVAAGCLTNDSLNVLCKARSVTGRKVSGYRYGFNGKENDNEIKGEGNQQDYGMRIYDPRIGRFLSVDPLSRKYAMLTPYQFASNTPIQAIDLDGLEAAVTTFFYNTRKDAKVKMTNAALVVDNTKPRSENFIINLNGESFKANSYTTLQGRDDRNNSNGDFSGIRKLSTDDIAGILGYSDFVFNVANQGKTKEQTVLHESGAGPLQTSRALLDFKNRAYEMFNFKQDELIAIDGVAYNANEAGNYLWGMALEEAGIMMNAKTIAELGTRGRHDEPHEQKAIQAGINKANSLLKTGVSKEVREKAFNYYMEDYYDFLQQGGDKSKFTPSDNLGVFKEYKEQNEPKK